MPDDDLGFSNDQKPADVDGVLSGPRPGPEQVRRASKDAQTAMARHYASDWDENAPPPRPWTWERIDPEIYNEKPVPEYSWGRALVAADGTLLISSESGWGRPDVHPAVKALLAAGNDVQVDKRPRPGSRGALRHLAHLDHDVDVPQQPDEELRRPLKSSYGKLAHLADTLGNLDFDDLLGIEQLTRERDEARAWAWSLQNREADYVAMGVDVDEDGNPVVPYWLTSPVPVWEHLYDVLLADFSASGYGTIYGDRVAGLALNDCVWVTDKSEPDPYDLTPAYVQVRRSETASSESRFCATSPTCAPSRPELRRRWATSRHPGTTSETPSRGLGRVVSSRPYVTRDPYPNGGSGASP